MLLRWDSRFDAVVGPLVGGLADELLAFGRLQTNVKLTSENFNRYLEQRAGLTLSLLRDLPGIIGLNWSDDVAVPYLYNRSEWSQSLGLSGISSPTSELDPKLWATSLILNWHLRCDGKSGALRLLTGLLWYSLTSDLQGTVTFALDLHRFGFCTTDDLIQVLVILLRGESIAGSLSEARVRFLGSDRVGYRDVLESDLTQDWVEAAPLSPQGKVCLRTVADAADAAVASARAARSIDDWFDRFYHAGGVLKAACQLLDLFANPLPLTWRSKRAAWEEIYADSNGSLLAALAGFGFPSLRNLATSLGGVAVGLQSVSPEDWRQRLATERLLLPDAFRSAMLSDDTGTHWPQTVTAQAWRQPAPDRVHVWAALIRPGTDVASLRSLGWPGAERDPATIDRLLGDLSNQIQAGDSTAIEATATALLEELPYLHFAYHERAIAADRAGRLPEAVAAVRTALVLDPRNHMYWQSAGVILRRMGRTDEGALAAALTQVLAARYG